MPKAYSLDLRHRVVQFVEAGHSRRAAAAHFAVSISFVVYLLKTWHTKGRFSPAPAGGRRHAKLDAHNAFLLAQVTQTNDITMPELAAALFAATGTRADPASISRWLIRKGYRFKKNTDGQRTRSPGYSKGAPRLENNAPAENAT